MNFPDFECESLYGQNILRINDSDECGERALQDGIVPGTLHLGEQRRAHLLGGLLRLRHMNQIVHFKRVFLQIVKLMQFVLGRGVFPAVLIEGTLLEVDLKVTVP